MTENTRADVSPEVRAAYAAWKDRLEIHAAGCHPETGLYTEAERRQSWDDLARLWDAFKAAEKNATLPQRLAHEIGDYLFVNGQGTRAERLALTVDGPPKRDLGGLAYRPAVDRIAAILERELAAADPSATNVAARELLFLAGIEGIGSLSRGGKGCVFRALQAVRPDIAELWSETEDPAALLRRFFPEE